jgi:single-stranded-DNA-specific exonuclease
VVLELVDNSYKESYEVRITDVKDSTTIETSQDIEINYFQNHHETVEVINPNLRGEEVWQNLVGIAKYLSRTNQAISYSDLQQKLGINMPILQLGLAALQIYDWQITQNLDNIQIQMPSANSLPDYELIPSEVEDLIGYVNESIFRQSYANLKTC